jgi:Predicted membrane protein (DUF2324).
MTATTPALASRRMRFSAAALIPAPIIACALVLTYTGGVDVISAVLGAVGWVVALLLRQPVAVLASRRANKARPATVVGWFSGPAEELVRLGIVLLAIRTVDEAVWAGFGWAAVEVLLIAVNTLAVANLLTKDDPKSLEARAILEGHGMLTQHHPAWGLFERLSATMLHIGFTLLLFAEPWLVLLTIPAHSLINVFAVRMAKKNIALTESVLAVTSMSVLLLGVAAALHSQL